MNTEKPILIVEDSPLQATMLRKLLQGGGYQVVVTRDGCEAIRSLEEVLPFVIISDVDMPEMDGYELCRVVKSDPRTQHIPVILLTSLSDPKNVIAGLQAGADNYVTKPFDGPGLLTRVSSLLQSPDLYRENGPGKAIEVNLSGEMFTIKAGRGQILNLLLSTFESAVWQNQKLRLANDELHSLHQEMADKNEQLEASLETQNRFLGMAAHDMRNPLSVMMGYSQLLVEGMVGSLEPTQLKLMKSISRASESLLSLVNELLEISELESGNLRLELVDTDLTALVRHAVEMNGFLAKNKKIIITPDLDSLSPMRLDAGKVEQVLNNLLSNAVKFSHPETEIFVRLKRRPNGGANLVVEDHGQGIPAEEQSQLFQPFQRTSVRGTAGEKSTGLGLAIVKRIVEGHGATIELDSESGRGSRFIVNFPGDL